MKTYDLIFSNRPGPRILRHSLFWLLCILFFEFTYFFPYYLFHGWNTHDTNAVRLQGAMGLSKFYFLALSNSLVEISVLVFFTYVLIYFLLPRYLVKEKYIGFTVSLLALLFISIIIFYFEFIQINPLIRRAFGLTPKIWATKIMITHSVDLVLFNCPAIGGVALGIKLVKRWWLKQKESQELATAITSAELQLLKAQVHPHFLFNTLNNIYSFMLNASSKAPEMVKKLSGLLHYIIHECNHPTVPLVKELKMIQDYMGLEKIRYGEQMDMQVDIRGDYSDKMIAPLLLIPFVENSFKHGASKMLSRPWVNLNIIVEEDTFYFMLNNSKPEEYASPTNNGGIGLANVQKRLQLLYRDRHELKMTEEQEHFTVLLEINLQTVKEKSKRTNKKVQHEMV